MHKYIKGLDCENTAEFLHQVGLAVHRMSVAKHKRKKEEAKKRAKKAKSAKIAKLKEIISESDDIELIVYATGVLEELEK